MLVKHYYPFGLDLPFLNYLEEKIIMTYCGSESRLINYIEINRNPYAHLLKFGLNNPKHDFKKIMIKWQSLWCNIILAPRDSYKNAIYVANKNKVLEKPWIHNLGFNIDNLASEIKTNKIPRIIHAPSNKDIKGTKYIEDAINNLKKRVKF